MHINPTLYITLCILFFVDLKVTNFLSIYCFYYPAEGNETLHSANSLFKLNNYFTQEKDLLESKVMCEHVWAQAYAFSSVCKCAYVKLNDLNIHPSDS